MQSLGGLLAVLWCGAVGAAPAVGSALQATAADALRAIRSEGTDEQWLRFEARLKALEASRARSGSEDAVRAAAVASPFVLFGLAWAYMPYRIMRLQDRLLQLGVKQAKKHSLCKV